MPSSFACDARVTIPALVAAARRTVESADEFGRTAEELRRASQMLRDSVGAFRLK